MRWWLSMLLIAGLAVMAAAQDGMEMQAPPPPVMLDLGPSWTADGTEILFSRVTTNQTGTAYNIVPVPAPVFQMPGEGGENSGGMETGEMVKPVEPEYRREGVFRVAATGGDPKQLIGGRALIQDANRTHAVVLFQGMGAAQYRSWGLYGLELAGGSSSVWYQGMPAWVRVSPDDTQFVLPHPKGTSFVFFPARENAKQFSGYCATASTGRPAYWSPDGTGVWVTQNAPDGGYSLGIGQPDQVIKSVIPSAGPGSFAVSIPGSTDVWVCMFMPPSANAWPVKLWPGDQAGLYLCDAQGKEKRKVTTLQPGDMEASPDGKLLAIAWGACPYALSIVSVDGGPVRRICSNLSGGVGLTRTFVWSPDGKKIAYPGLDEQGNGIFVVDVQTAEVTRVSTAPIIPKK